MLQSKNIYEVYSIKDLYNAFSLIKFDTIPGQPIWYRGANNYTHNLIPSLFRESNNEFNSDNTYSQLSLREDYRYQNFKTRVFHNVNTNPSNKLEWQALYQHYWGKTRMLDWSESAFTALTFALEPFIDPRERHDLEIKRHDINPCIWILNPSKLNEIVYEQLIKSFDKMPNILGDVFAKEEFENAINRLNDLLNEPNSKKIYFSPNSLSTEKKIDLSLSGIFSLCVMDDFRKNNLSRLSKMLLQGEYNPFFYLLLRVYADSFPIFVDEENTTSLELIPPLAILHPYQSERIRAQRGTFTVFPVYRESEKIKFYKERNMDIRAMDINESIKDCLYCIRLFDPERLSKEILLTGSRHTEIYPDNEFFVHTLEAKSFHL